MKAQLVVMSHLSDAQELMRLEGNPHPDGNMYMHVNFAKYIISQCEGNLNQKIDPDAMFENYKKSIS